MDKAPYQHGCGARACRGLAPFYDPHDLIYDLNDGYDVDNVNDRHDIHVNDQHNFYDQHDFDDQHNVHVNDQHNDDETANDGSPNNGTANHVAADYGATHNGTADHSAANDAAAAGQSREREAGRECWRSPFQGWRYRLW